MRPKFATRLRRRQRTRQKTLNLVTIFLIIIIPVYPAFGNYIQDYTGAIVRGNYDESTILATYDGNTGVEIVSTLLETDFWSDGGTLVDTALQDAERLPDTVVVSQPAPPPSGPKEDPKRILYPIHVVTPKQTLEEITKQYNVSLEALLAANLWLTPDIKIDQKIRIPSIKWAEYIVKKGDTLSVIAQKYGVENISHILIANDLPNASQLRIGQKLLLPNPKKDPNAKQEPNPKKPDAKPAVVKAASPAPVKKPDIQPAKTANNTLSTITYGSYSLNLKVDKGCRNFAWGNCTCFVAKYKNVTWRWNAKHWLKNAQKAGVPTGQDPKPGAIIVYDGYGYSPYYGHVGIVMEVDENFIIVKDMNYSGLNQITTRREEYKKNRAIKGYIYVD